MISQKTQNICKKFGIMISIILISEFLMHIGFHWMFTYPFVLLSYGSGAIISKLNK